MLGYAPGYGGDYPIFMTYNMNQVFKQVAEEGYLVEIVDEDGEHMEYLEAERFGNEGYMKDVGFIHYFAGNSMFIPERMTIWGHLLEDGYTYRAMATMANHDGDGYYGNIAMSSNGIRNLARLKDVNSSSMLSQIVWLDEGYDDDYTPQYELTYGNERIKIYNAQDGFLYLYPES